MWRKVYGIEWAVEHDSLCVKATNSGKTYVLPPFGADRAYTQVLELLQDYFGQQGLPFYMRAVPRRIMNIIEESKPGLFNFQAQRDSYDYVYNMQDLCGLKGRKYSRKRNHIQNFKQAYSNYMYLPLTEDLVQDCIDNELEWCEKRNCDEVPDLRCEKFAIMEALLKFRYLELIGGVITIDDKVEAFTFGEALNENTAVIHVEKGNPDINGIYAVISQVYCCDNWQSMQYINREEDMGIAGLRKAKKSYYPVTLIEKFDVTAKDRE
jgi:uncharacterized protein